ncbi:glycosyltransferase family 4 protein [Flavobacterium orientale]|uniref:Glycosyl transferase family 1 n=1 Tax=Flavobacterium orientale TaxID=1756020 RepID=A0A917D9W2_9FLAO|nr:glycosyltransferase family 4 protein [Flavobacterium orientale]GGD15096.1 glycosyl transferase family 1 [Flavobacterium orientale]
MNKRLLLLTSEFPPLPGGIGTHAFHLASELSEKGYTVQVHTNRRMTDYEEEAAFDRSQSFTVRRTERKNWGRTYLYRIAAVLQIVKQKQPHILIASGKFSLWMGALISLFFTSISSVAIIHGTELKAGGFFSRWFTKMSLKRFEKVVAVSHFTKNKIAAILPDVCVTVIPNGIVLPAASFSDVQKELPVSLVTVGNLTRRKGQHNVINALPELLSWKATIQYHCVGLPTELEAIKAKINELQLGDSVIFHGVLTETEKRVRLQKSHVFIMLSEHLANGDFEGFGIAVLEANALGLPAIGSVNSGIADAIQEGYSGKLVDPHDPIAIKAALIEIYADYETYSSQAKVWSQQFQWKDIIEKYTTIIES